MPKILLEICPGCGGKMQVGSYVCRSCHSNPREPMVLAFDEPEYKRKRYSRGLKLDDICRHCPMLKQCEVRVANGGWCFCEIPSEEDVLIVELGGM